MNRRKSLPLARGAALVALSLTTMVARSDASQPCLKPEPKTCQIPEDCFFKRQIAMKRGLRDAFASSALRCRAWAAAKRKLGPHASAADVSAKAADLLYEDIAGHPERIARTLPRCRTALADPPGWETASDCTFQAKGADGKPMSDPDGTNTCSEFLTASREHERVHVAVCKAARAGQATDLGATSGWVPHGGDCDGASYNQGAPKVPNRRDLNDYADEEADAYTEEIWELEDARAAAIRRCTTARDAAAAAERASRNAQALGQMTGGGR